MLWRHSLAECREDRAEYVRIGKVRGTHSGVSGKWFGTAAVEVEAHHIVLNDLRRLDGDLWVGGAYLEDEIGLLDRMCREYGLRLPIV